MRRSLLVYFYYKSNDVSFELFRLAEQPIAVVYETIGARVHTEGIWSSL